jgi:hypothetical protein
MPAIERTYLSQITRNAPSQTYTRAIQTDEQREARNEVERNQWNRNQLHINVAFTPIELHSVIMWKSITVNIKSLLLDQ